MLKKGKRVMKKIMSEETKQKEVEADFAKAIDHLNELRGG